MKMAASITPTTGSKSIRMEARVGPSCRKPASTAAVGMARPTTAPISSQIQPPPSKGSARAATEPPRMATPM